MVRPARGAPAGNAEFSSLSRQDVLQRAITSLASLPLGSSRRWSEAFTAWPPLSGPSPAPALVPVLRTSEPAAAACSPIPLYVVLPSSDCLGRASWVCWQF